SELEVLGHECSDPANEVIGLALAIRVARFGQQPRLNVFDHIAVFFAGDRSLGRSNRGRLGRRLSRLKRAGRRGRLGCSAGGFGKANTVHDPGSSWNAYQFNQSLTRPTWW